MGEVVVVDTRYERDVARLAEAHQSQVRALDLNPGGLTSFPPRLRARAATFFGERTDADAIRELVVADRWVYCPRLIELGRPVAPRPLNCRQLQSDLPGTSCIPKLSPTQKVLSRTACCGTRWSSTDRKERILFVTYGYPPEVGGVAESSRRIVVEFRQRGHEVTVFAPALPNTPPREPESMLRAGTTWWRSEAEFEVLIQMAEREHVRQKFDIVLGFFLVPAGMVAVAIGARLQLPVVVSARGNDVSKGLFTAPRRTDWVMRHANCIVTVSTDLRDLIQCLSTDFPPLMVVPNSVQTPTALPTQVSQRRSVPRVGIAGILRWKKGWQTFLHAAALVEQPVDLRVIGDVVDEERAEFDALVAELGLQVSCSGIVPEGRVVELLDELDLFVSPSIDEGMPNTLIKAISRGIPVVVTDLSGHRALIPNEAMGVIVAPGCAVSLACGIEDGLSACRTERATAALCHLQNNFRPIDEYKGYLAAMEHARRHCANSRKSWASTPTYF